MDRPQPTDSDGSAVSVDALVMVYDGRPVVDGLSLRADTAAVTAVLGPNGAGKTTTIETCEGYRRPAGGSVRVLGLDPIRDRRTLSPQVGVMLQSGGVYGAVSPRSALRHAAGLYADPQPPEHLVSRLGLTAVADTHYRRLSGGQQQRLGIALAVIGRPRVIFLDEPTAGLDPQSRHSTWELIADLRSAGIAVVLTTHYLEEAEQLADHVVIVDAGKVVAEGQPADLTASLGGDVLRFRAIARLDLKSLAEAMPGPVNAVETTPGSYQLSGSEASALLPALTQWSTTHGIRLNSVVTEHPSLQDVFLTVTGREMRP